MRYFQKIKKNNFFSNLANQWKKDRNFRSITFEEIDQLPNKKFIITPKIDGELTVLEYKNGEVTYFSRHGKIRKNLPFDKEIKKAFSKFKSIVVFGELYTVNEKGDINPYQITMSILRKPDEKTINQIRFAVFDIYKMNDKLVYNDPYLERIKLVKQLFDFSKKIKSIPFIVSNKEKMKEIFNKYVKTNKFEGIVVWDEKNVYKIKQFLNIDAVVIFVERSKKHPNRMGALGLALLDNKKLYYLGSVGTGFTEKQRIKWLKYALKNKKKVEGDKIFINPKIVVEINAKSLNIGNNEIYDFDYNVIGESNFGSLREPKFMRIRKDKYVQESDVGLTQIKNFIDKFNEKLNKESFIKLQGSVGGWFINNKFVKIAISLNQLNIDIPQNLNEKEKIEKIFNMVYMDPTSKFNNEVLNLKSLDEFINKFSMEYKGNKYLNTKLVKSINGEFLGVINKFYDHLIKYGIENVRNGFINSLSKSENKKVLLDKNVTIEDIKAVLGLIENKEIKVEKHYEKVAEKEIDGVKYTLYRALSPYGIKRLANAGFSTWCVNSINYAKSYWNNKITQEKGFWYIFKNGTPFYAIGGSDGISNLFNISLSDYSTKIHEYDYQILKEWQPIYKYNLRKQKVLTKEQFEQKIKNLIDRLNNKEKIKDYDWEIIFTYSDKIRNAVDINSLLDLTLRIDREIRKGDGDYITKVDLLVFIAKFINRGPFEKNLNIKKEILEKVQEKISEDFNASIDYLKSVTKEYKEEYKVYRKGLIETLYKDFDSSDYENDIDDLRFILNAISRANDTLDEEEKKYLNLLINDHKNIQFFFLANYDTIKKIGLDIDKNELYNNVIKDPHNSFEFAKELDFKEVPKEIISSISKDIEYSYKYAKALKFQNVPQEIINSISKDPSYSYKYAEHLNFEKEKIPSEIFNSITQSPEYSYYYAGALNFQNVPPEIVSSISEDLHYSYKYAEDLNFEKEKIPPKIFNLIIQSSEYSYNYAKALKFQNVPPEIISSISKEQFYSFEYAKRLNFEKEKIPPEIFKSITQSPDYSYYYAEALNFQNVPPEIISSISKNPEYSYYYAKTLNFNFQNIPQEIIHAFINEYTLKYLFKYLEEINFDIQRIPEDILLKIFKMNIHNLNIEKMKIQYALYCIQNNQLEKLKLININKEALLPYIANYPNKEEILKHVTSNQKEWFLTKQSIRYKERKDVFEPMDWSFFEKLNDLIGTKSVEEILEKTRKILKLNQKEYDILKTPDGIAYLAQAVNYAAKIINPELYKIKNILTRWLARNHPRAYFDKDLNILYVKVGEGQQISFHVGHDIGLLGYNEYNRKVHKTYLSRSTDPVIEFDGRYRQDLSNYGLYNYLNIRNDILDPVLVEENGKYYVYLRNKAERLGPFNTKEEAYEYINKDLEEIVKEENPYYVNISKKSSFEFNTLQIRIEGQLRDDIISFVKRNFLQKYLYYNPNLHILGRVLNPHITVIFFKNSDFDKIIEYFKEKNIEYIELELGEIKKFSSDKDVFYIEVFSESLNKINEDLSKILNEPQPFKFVAHISLAYVQKGTHDFLLNNPTFKGIKYRTSIIEVSYGMGKKYGEFYNLKNKDRGKVVDIMYQNSFKFLKPDGNIGIDFDYTITANPTLFKNIIDLFRSNGYKAYIITGRGPKIADFIKSYLSKYNIEVDGIYNFYKDLTDDEIINDKNAIREIYNFKFDKAKELNIKYFFDDDINVILGLPKEIQKIYIPPFKQRISNGKFIYPEKSENKFENIINQLVYVANKYGYKLYAAGGYVRDLILGKESKDLDIIVIKDSEGINAPLEFAKKVKQEFGE